MATTSRPLRLRTLSDPTGRGPLWDTPAGRYSVRQTTPYGDVQGSYPVNPNVATLSAPAGIPPQPTGDATPLSPDVNPLTPVDRPNVAEAAAPQNPLPATTVNSLTPPDFIGPVQPPVAPAASKVGALVDDHAKWIADASARHSEFMANLGKPITFGESGAGTSKSRNPWTPGGEVVFNTGSNDALKAWTPRNPQDPNNHVSPGWDSGVAKVPDSYKSAGTPTVENASDRYYQRKAARMGINIDQG